jgi:predicted acylesterase/phospholipase RssA
MLARLQSKMHVTRSAGHLSRNLLNDPQSVADSPALQLLRQFLGVSPTAIPAGALGKVGLALSGGGFRASFFHIGVLAALAEHDLLRHVEVLSCVSGGSILGTHYYLELQRLLETKADSAITPDDYVAIIRRVASSFLAGVQQNVRMRAFGNPADNLRMYFSKHYSRTHKIGELYEKHLYSRVERKGNEPARFISDLRIRPAQASPEFHPRDENWRRAAKVPALVVNTSALNSGHQWQFTTTFMGNRPASSTRKWTATYRLRRMYYEQAPDPYKTIRLGYAVGRIVVRASALRTVAVSWAVQGHRHHAGGRRRSRQPGHPQPARAGLRSPDHQRCERPDGRGQRAGSRSAACPVPQRLDFPDAHARPRVSRSRQPRPGGVATATYMHLKQGLE